VHNYWQSLYHDDYYSRRRDEKIAQVRQRQQKLENEARCIICAVPLLEEEGKRCVNCTFVSNYRRVETVV